MKRKTILYLGAAAVGAAASAYVALYLRKQALLLSARAEVARQNYIDSRAISDRYVRVLNCDTHYYVVGDRTGLPLVFLHGGAVDAASFLDNMSFFGTERYVLAPDLPAHGRSSFLNPHLTLEWLEAWAQAMGLEQFDLMAHSTGGGIAARYVLAYPHRVRKLILCAPTGYGLRWPHLDKFWLPWDYVRRDEYGAEIARRIWGNPSRLTAEQLHYFNHITHEMFSTPRWLWYVLGGFKWMLEISPSRLSRLRVLAAMFVWGMKDPLVPVLESQPRADLCLLDAGHMAYMETPDEFNKAVKEFLDGS